MSRVVLQYRSSCWSMRRLYQLLHHYVTCCVTVQIKLLEQEEVISVVTPLCHVLCCSTDQVVGAGGGYISCYTTMSRVVL